MTGLILAKAAVMRMYANLDPAYLSVEPPLTSPNLSPCRINTKSKHHVRVMTQTDEKGVCAPLIVCALTGPVLLRV